MKPLELLKIIIATFQSTEVLNTARTSEKALTRERKMPFREALHFMLDMRTTTLQTRLNMFFFMKKKETL
jgi:hypothetical protein